MVPEEISEADQSLIRGRLTRARAHPFPAPAHLEAAGVERVRVFSVPGSPNHAGTWAGTVDLFANCEGAPDHIGYGVQIAYHSLGAPPAPGKGFIDLELPQGKPKPDQVIDVWSDDVAVG